MDPGNTIALTFSFIGGAKDLADRLFPNWTQGRVSLFLLGAQGTGKTSFIKTIKRLSLENIHYTNKSTLLEKTSTSYPFDDGRSITIVCYDFGGDNAYRDVRRQAVIDSDPTAILFFFDQRDIRKEIPRDIRLTNDRLAVKEWEFQNRQRLAKLDEQRIQEHYRHFDDLCQLIQSNSSLNDHTRLVVPIVTKYDIWREILLIEEFDSLFSNNIRQLGQLGRDVAPLVAASPVEYIGTPEIMNTVFERAGREYRFLNWKWRRSP